MEAELDTIAATLAGLVEQAASLDDSQTADALRALSRLRGATDALWLELVAVAEQRRLGARHGHRDTASWLAGIAGERVGTARRDVELAEQLDTVPLLAGAVAAGVVSKTKAVELVRAEGLPESVQQALVERAPTQSVVQVAQAVRHARLSHGAAEPDVEATCTLIRSPDRVQVAATVDLVDGEILEVALDTMAEALKLPTELPYPQRRAAALVGLAKHYLDHADQIPTSRVGRPHVLVLVDIEVLEARRGGTATLASGAVITGDQARQLAVDANICRIITQGRSEILDLGRATRTATPAQTKAVIARDRHCRYEHCHAPPWACEIHHLLEWIRSGPTDLDNLGLLCWHHHKEVHRHGAHHLRQQPDGRWTLTPPHDLTHQSAA